MVKDAILSTAASDAACKGFEAQVDLMAQAMQAIKSIASSTQFSGQEQVAAKGPGQQRVGPSDGIV